MKARTLKIESTGDFFAGKVQPKIRISGRWLEAAGFRPGHHVQVNILEPGRITLQFIEATSALHDLPQKEFYLTHQTAS